MSRTDEIRERLDAAGREYRADDGREAHRRDAIIRAPTDIAWLLDRADELAAALDVLVEDDPWTREPACDGCVLTDDDPWFCPWCGRSYTAKAPLPLDAEHDEGCDWVAVRAALARYRGAE